MVAKIVIDQTVGAAWNTVLFIMTISMLHGQNYDLSMEQVRSVSDSGGRHGGQSSSLMDLCRPTAMFFANYPQDFWPILLAGLKMWPFVSILNFTVVPADNRLLVGNLFGVVWAVYLSLIAG